MQIADLSNRFATAISDMEQHVAGSSLDIKITCGRCSTDVKLDKFGMANEVEILIILVVTLNNFAAQLYSWMTAL